MRAGPRPTPSAPASRGETTPKATLPDTADCRVETVADTGPVTYTVPIPRPGSKKRVAQCLMPPKQALALVNKGTLLVVDTRRPDDFERYRIPGSLNIALPFVKTKAFLRDRAFVLVDAGRASGTLEDSCRQLRAAGFKQAAVLRGGLIGWRGANGAIEGDLLGQRELTRMAPVELAQEGAYDDWIVLSLAAAPAAEVRKFIPQAVPLKAGIEAKLAAEVKAAVAKRSRKGVEPRVLLVDSDGTRTERIEHLLGGKLAYPVMLLDGGLAGYRKFWTEQAAIWAALERGPRKPGCGV
jgi:rhodanese-related sulfurtransferase